MSQGKHFHSKNYNNMNGLFEYNESILDIVYTVSNYGAPLMIHSDPCESENTASTPMDGNIKDWSDVTKSTNKPENPNDLPVLSWEWKGNRYFQHNCPSKNMRIKGKHVTWVEADKICRLIGAHLISLHEMEEMEMLKDMFLNSTNYNTPPYYYIGLRYKVSEGIR